jgi:hypothetical protein
MYSAVDPIFMLMLIKNLGPTYNIWDKAAHIRFRKPGRRTLFARFLIDEIELNNIREELDGCPSIDRNYQVDLADADGLVHATIEKTIYLAKRVSPK